MDNSISKANLLELLDELTSQTNDCGEKNSDLHSIFQTKYNNVVKKYELFVDPAVENVSLNVQYVNLLSQLLEKLRLFLDDEAKSSDELFISVKELKIILSSLEFLIAFGVRPCLTFDLGFISKNSEKIDKNQNNFGHKLNDETKKFLLDKSLTCLLDLCRCQAVQANVISKYLNFILAGILQFTFCPDFPEFHQKYREILENFLTLVYRPLIIREFMIFQRIKCPVWLKTACADFLSNFLSEPNGLGYFLQVSKELGANFDDHKYCRALATLIGTAPKKFKNCKQKYYENISDQVWKNYRVYYEKMSKTSSKTKFEDDYGCFFVFVVRKLFSVDEKSFRRHFQSKLTLPLVKCTSEGNFPSDENLTECLEMLHYFLCVGPTDVNFSQNFVDFLPIFMNLFVNIENTASFCVKIVKEIVISLVQTSNAEIFVEICKFWLREIRTINFAVSSTGGIGIRKNVSEFEEFNFDSNVIELIKILTILPEEIQSKFVCEFVVDCLKRLTHAKPDLDEIERPSTSTTTCFVQIDEKVRLIEENLLNFTLLTALIEQFGDVLSKDVEKILDLCNAIFISYSCKKDEDLEEFSNQTLITCFGLISLVLTNLSPNSQKDSSVLESRLVETVSHLKTLSENYPNTELRQMAKSLVSSLNLSDVKIKRQKESSNVTSPPSVTKRAGWQPKKPTYEEALKDMNDSLLPIRAHGIIAMTNLLKIRHPEAVGNLDQLFDLFFKNLEDEDSYVFLPAINAIVTVGDLRTNLALNRLLKKFVDYQTTTKNDDDAKETSVKNQMKIGEATVKLSRNFGDLGPHYALQIINTFLSMLKNEDENIRASCLSNIGEIAALASYKISSCLHELIFAVSQILTHDKTSIVRRAAVHLLRNILSGSSKEMLQILEGEMLNVYRLLKNVNANDKDDVVRLHAQICLEIIDENVKLLSTNSVSQNYSIRTVSL